MKRSNNKQQHFDGVSGSIDEHLKLLEHLERSKPPPALEKSTGFLMASTVTRMRIAMLRKIKEYGYDITPEQGAVLNAIEESEGISQSGIAERTMKDKPTITRILDILEKKELISRHPAAGDRRMYKIYLTESGRKKIAMFKKIIDELDKKAFMGLNANDIKKLKEILDVIRANVE